MKHIKGGEKALYNSANRFPIESVVDILTAAREMTGNAAIGVEAGKNFRPDTFEDVGQALMVSRTLRHASAVMHRFQPLFQQIGRSYITVHGDLAWNYWDTCFKDPEYARLTTEATLISHAQFGRWLTWQHDLKVDFVHFRHSKPPYHALYDDIFKAPVHFNQARDAVVLNAGHVDMPLPQANQERLEDLCLKLGDALKKLDTPKTYSERTERTIYALLDKGMPDLSQTAESMGISARSLRRHLAHEETNFRNVLEETRRKLCEQYLSSQRISLSEIAERLGYSEQSAFNRAFKKWYGESPKAYAKAMQVFEKAFDQMAP